MTRYEHIVNYVPDFLRDLEPIKTIHGNEGDESQLYFESISDVIDQLFVETATWGLDAWESFLNIETIPDKADEYRRSVILSKIQGVGTVTSDFVKSVSLAFENGEVEVVEKGNFEVEIVFTGIKGVPPNYDDYISMLEDIKPAHLKLTFTITFLTWDEYESYNYTWDQWDALNITWDELETYQG